MRYYIYSHATSISHVVTENISTLTIEEWKAEQNIQVSEQASHLFTRERGEMHTVLSINLTSVNPDRA